MNIGDSQIEAYLRQCLGQPVQILSVQALAAESRPSEDMRATIKTYGYGRPILIRYMLDGVERRAVLRTMASNSFGHEYRADRAASLLLSYDTFNDLPRHVRALDVGALSPDGHPVSLGCGGEFFLLTDYAAGTLYADDLQRLRDTGGLTDRDTRRAVALAGYLAQIHATRCDDPALYRRAVRDLVGGGEGIFGLTDSYPPDFPLAGAAWLERVEQACVRWRWLLKQHPRRLAQIHGDFHPFNVLFGDGVDFWLLDRSRGGWGEPADDVCAMAINYLFFSLQRAGELAPPFTQLWDGFWQTYLEQTRDEQLLALVAPFLVWRALVVASPVWYNVPEMVRAALYRFIDRVIDAPVFDPENVNAYLRP